MKVALVHDSVIAYGGAERTLEVLLTLFPDAPLYTAIFRPMGAMPSVGARRVETSVLQRVPLPVQVLKPLFPLAFERFRLPDDADVILSSSSGYAKGIRPPRSVVHVAYIHTPLRRAWNPDHLASRRTLGGRTGRLLESTLLAYLRRWDVGSAKRVDHFVANSENTALQVQRIYGREAVVIHPPVRASFFVPATEQTVHEYFLVVSRLDPYKRIDLAIQAANALRAPLVIVGDGVAHGTLQRLAGKTVKFLGTVDDVALRSLYQGCRALIFPGEEDFGIAPVEAQACGRPVIAFAAGGVLETVIEGVTGLFFHEPTADSVVRALERFDSGGFDREQIRENALRFDETRFEDRISRFIRRATFGASRHRDAGPR